MKNIKESWILLSVIKVWGLCKHMVWKIDADEAKWQSDFNHALGIWAAILLLLLYIKTFP